MSQPFWFRRLFVRKPSAPARRRPARWRPTLEALEDRLVPSTLTVMNTNDSGAGSLRQAILDANTAVGPDVITFDPTAFGTPQTIRLLSPLPNITDDLTIAGPTTARLTISGDANNDGVNDPGDVRLLSVSAGNVALSYLTLANGRAQGADAPPFGEAFIPGSPGLGGALYIAGGTVTLNNSALTDNTAQGGNGGLVHGSQASDGGVGQGGAIYVAAGGDVIVNNCTLSGNSAEGGKGGGYGGDFGTTNPGRGGNAEGGGIYIAAGGAATLSNSTLSGNTALGGAGGDHSPPPLGVDEPPGRAFGGGLSNQGTAWMANTIVAGNQLGGLFRPTASDVQGTIASGGYNLIGITGRIGAPGNPGSSGWVSTDLTGTVAAPLDPLLAALGDYGGPTPTIALLPGSPALDAGNNDLVPAGITTDQRGFARVSGAAVDIGACEVQLPTLSPAALPNGISGVAYSQAITATEETGGAGGPYTFAVTAGVLPDGLSLASDGTLSGAPTTLGSSTFMVTATDSAGFTAGRSYTLTFDKVVPTVTVNPINLVYGTALADDQLSGTATAVVYGQTVSVLGTFFFGIFGQRTAGTVLSAGDHYQWFTFVPDDPTTYAYLGTSVPVKVARATPALTWATPAAITYGTPLSDSQLDAQAGWTVGGSPVAVPGTFTYSPAAGTILNAGSQTLAVHFVPADTADYNTPADQTVSLTVNPAVLTVTAGSASRVYGAANPALTYSITGFVNNDPATVVSGTPILTTAATAGSPPGNYAITSDVSPLSAANYTFSPVNGTLTVTPAPLTAAAVNFSATAGAPFSGTVATFTTPDQIDSAAAFAAVITWGDGSTSTGVVSGSNGSFTVCGTHTYAAAGSYAVCVQISNPDTQAATANDTATVTALGQGVTKGLTGTIGFWQSTGQPLIQSFNGGPAATALANWLAATFPNLYGAGAGANNLTGKSNAQVAAFYLSQFALGGPKVEAQVLATALSVYASTQSLGGTAGQAYTFRISAAGLGAYTYSVGSDGAAFGVANNTVLDVYQLLQAVNRKAVSGKLYNGNATLRKQAVALFDALNQAGSVG
jgi:hypothetical protein